jgi:transcriptional antiterminator RfaH
LDSLALFARAFVPKEEVRFESLWVVSSGSLRFFDSMVLEDWHVLLVRPGHELRVERLIVGHRDVEVYVPYRSEARQLSDRTKVARRPLLTGYAFVRGNLRDCAKLVTLPSITGFLRFGERLATVKVTEMDAIRIMAEKFVAVEAWHDISLGLRIRILSGPLTGCEGEIVDRKTGSFFTVRLDLLGRQIATPIDLSQTKVAILPDTESS